MFVTIMNMYFIAVECERKRKLPAGRVGANFSETGVDANWMPSFGRVWSKNTRKNQRYTH